ncbi:MAG: hypothetical protein QOK28_3906 [Actinomycetota bacterium]|jgi:hypothetical protein
MAPRTLRTDAVTVHMNASCERVYDLISDVTRMGEWSPECHRCEWIDGASGPAVAARFNAYNRRGLLRWSNTPTVIVADRPNEFAFARSTRGSGEYVWRYRLVPSGSGTEVTESYEATKPESLLVSNFVRLFTPGTEASHLRAGMEQTLARISSTIALPVDS